MKANSVLLREINQAREDLEALEIIKDALKEIR